MIAIILLDPSHRAHPLAGLIGCKFLLNMLSDGGYAADALRLVVQTSQPSWGYMVNNGEGTLWEQWTGSETKADGSRNHIMFGSAMAWFYQGLAGISLPDDATAVAWDQIRINPALVSDPGYSTPFSI